MVGKKILHYQLIDKIGAGGMGEIYKGQDTRLNRLVAVKILAPNFSTDPERKRRFFQEAQAASALNHPNIITLYDIVQEGDMQCIVMEYISGKTLRDMTPAGGLPPAQALQYGIQIASALSAAHEAGLIHRDLKPSNIMVTTTGLAKVLDFGLAKWVDSGISGEHSTMETALTREGSIIGTVSYMSPEQAEGKRVDARSDIFSFGSVLYEMLTGKRAFEGRSGISTLSSILRDDVKPMSEAAPEVPPLLEQIVLRCLSKEPAARWQSMKEIEAALISLQRMLDPEGHFAPPIPTGPVPAVPLHTSFPVEAAVAVTPAAPVAAVSVESSPSVELAPEPVAVGVANGPTLPVSTTSKTATTKAPAAAKGPETKKSADNGQSQQPPSKPPVESGRRPSGFPKMAVVLLGLLGAALVAGAAIGGWYWWKGYHYGRTNAVATNVQPAPATPPPVEEKKSPLGESPNAQPSAESAPAPPATAADQTPNAPKSKRKQARSEKAAPTTVPPLPTPAAPTPLPAPPQVAAPPPPKPAPKLVVQTTPVMVADALPFVINLDQDVASDAPEGQSLRFTVMQPLQVGDKTVIPKGASVTGAVMGEKGGKFLGIGGHKLTFRLTQAEAADGRKIAVRAMAGKAGEGPTVRPFETGKGVKSKGYAARAGTTYIGYIDGDQMVSVRK